MRQPDKTMENNRNKKAIVIGATGLVGNAVVELLLASEHFDKVITLTRRKMSHSSDKFENHTVDFDQLDKHAALFKADLLISCLGTTLKQAGSLSAQRTVDLDYQFMVAQLAANHGINHYLLVSSSGANSTSKNAYLQMKGELEEKVSTLNFARISILQPSLLLGQRTQFRFGETVGAWLLPTLCLIPGLQKYRPIRAQKVAQKLYSLTLFEASGLEYFRLDQIFD